MDLAKKNSREYFFKKSNTNNKPLLNKLLYQKVSRGVFTIITILLLTLLISIYAYGYSDIHSIQATEIINQDGKAEYIKPFENISFRFNTPIKKDVAEKGFSIMPAIKGELTFENNFVDNYSEKITFIPSEPYAPETNYIVTFSKLESLFGTKASNTSYSFKTISPPEIIGIEPNDHNTNTPVKTQIKIITAGDSPYFYLKFSLEPETKIFVSKTDGGIYKIDSEGNLTQGLDYIVKAEIYYTPDLNSQTIDNQSPLQAFSSSFRTVPPVEIISTSPGNNDWILDSLPEIKVEFDRAVDYGMAEKNFSIEPQVKGKFGWEENALIFEPLEELEKGKTYTYKINEGLKAYKDTGYLEQTAQYTFSVKKSEKSVPMPSDLKPQIMEGKYIDIDISDQVMTLFDNGKNLDSFQISSGTYSTPTPFGTFKILNKSPLAYSSQYDLYMPYWMAFTSAGHGIHELPYWRYKGGEEYKERESHLGIRVSHGCVRLGVGPAETVYNWAEIGTPIVVHD